MTKLDISVLDIGPEPYAAAPALAVRLQVTEHSGEQVHAMALRCQLRIEPRRRAYSDAEKSDLGDLFGPAARWGQTLRPLLWAQASTMVQGFTGATEVDLPLPCSYDFDVAASKYLHALGDGDVPLSLLFSGTVFTRGDSGFCVEQIPWSLEAEYRMPVAVWRGLMDAYFPNSGWVRLDREVVERLARFRTDRGLVGWDQVMSVLLATAASASAPASSSAAAAASASAPASALAAASVATSVAASVAKTGTSAVRHASCIETLAPVR